MKLCIYRGTHQIGGMAAAISTDTTRILIDMGAELSLEPGFKSAPLQIPGVTDTAGTCDGVLFTHYHGDHMGQLEQIREGIPLWSGPLAKDIMILSEQHSTHPNLPLCRRLQAMNTFEPGEKFCIGDIEITPYSVDHSACDSYMFLLEAGGRRVLYTGDFRMHGIRGKGLPKILNGLIQKVDVIITEGTTLSRPRQPVQTEWNLQAQVRSCLKQYKYVYVLCATTNLDRIFAFAQAVPEGKYCICDRYQIALVKTVSEHWKKYSDFYLMPKLTIYGKNLDEDFRRCGGLMFVRDSDFFRNIIRKFDREQSIILYSMWDGYRTKPGSTIPAFLNLAGTWKHLHTSGHASAGEIRQVIDTLNPELVIPMHTDAPEQLQALCPGRKVRVLKDREELSL